MKVEIVWKILIRCFSEVVRLLGDQAADVVGDS